MFDALLPPIYKWLRRRARLSQEGLAKDLDAGRSTIYKFEHGTKRPAPEQEARMIELAGCSDEELGERLRHAISEAVEQAALALQRAKRNLKDLAAVVEEQIHEPLPPTGATGRGVRPVFHTSDRDAGRDRETQIERRNPCSKR